VCGRARTHTSHGGTARARKGERAYVRILIKRNLRRRRRGRGARDTPRTTPEPRPLAVHFYARHSLALSHANPFRPEAIDASSFSRSPARVARPDDDDDDNDGRPCGRPDDTHYARGLWRGGGEIIIIRRKTRHALPAARTESSTTNTIRAVRLLRTRV